VVDGRGNATLKVLPEGFVLVEAGTFLGKPATAKVFLNPANITKILPAGWPDAVSSSGLLPIGNLGPVWKDANRG
jgi:hypothetical protein